MTPTLGCHPRGEDGESTQGASTGVQLLSCELGASQPASSPGRSSGCLGSVAPFFPECPPPLPAPAGSVPGAMLPGGSPSIPADTAAALGAVNQHGAAPPPRSPLAAAPLVPLIGAVAAARPYIRRRSAGPAPSDTGEQQSCRRAARRALRDALPPPRRRRAAPLARE